MDIDDYARWASEVARVAGGSDDPERLAYLGLGLAGEVGEVVGHLKRRLRDGPAGWRPEAVTDELGDVAYYWAALCVAVGADPHAVLEASRAKITARIAAGR